jgi:hypothetical protein
VRRSAPARNLTPSEAGRTGGRRGLHRQGVRVSIGQGGQAPLRRAHPLLRKDRPASPQVADFAVFGLDPVGLSSVLAYLAAGFTVLAVDRRPERIDAVRSFQAPLPLPHSERLRHYGASPALSFATAAGPGSPRTLVVVAPRTAEDAEGWTLPARCLDAVGAATELSTVVLWGRVGVGTTRRLIIEPLADRSLVAGRLVHVGVLAVTAGGHLAAVGGVTEACARSAARAGLVLHTGAAVVTPPETAELGAVLLDAHDAADRGAPGRRPGRLAPAPREPSVVRAGRVPRPRRTASAPWT